MTKQEILQYVLNTPHNTNITILEQKIDEYAGENSSTGSDEKILYMDASLLDAGGAYAADADDYTTAVIPAEATFVSLDAFANLPKLRTVVINGDCEFETYVETLEMGSLYYNALNYLDIKIRKIEVRDRAEIPQSFLVNSQYLKELDVVGSIGAYAFQECFNLKDINLDGVTSIGESAFSSCNALTEVTIPDSVTQINDYSFARCYQMTKVTLPNNITEIPNSMFYWCENLYDVVVPDSVTRIGAYAFFHTNLTSIAIPANVTNIEFGAFEDCYNLETITILGMETVIDEASTIPPATKIRGYAGSTAETYAIENNYTFEVIE